MREFNSTEEAFGRNILKSMFFLLNTIYNEWKNRIKDYHLINLLNIIVIFVVTGMCSKDGYHDISRLDILTRKSLRYQHHRENYLESLEQGIIPSGLKLKNWKRSRQYYLCLLTYLVLNEAEEKLVEELLIESEKSIASVETKIQLEMKDRNTNDFLRERREIDRNHAQFKHQLEQRRIKK